MGLMIQNNAFEGLKQILCVGVSTQNVETQLTLAKKIFCAKVDVLLVSGIHVPEFYQLDVLEVFYTTTVQNAVRVIFPNQEIKSDGKVSKILLPRHFKIAIE